MKEKEIAIKSLEETESGATFEGWLSTYGNTDRDGDVIIKGAFAQSVARKSTVPLCFNHDRNKVIGKLELTDDDKGLHVLGTLNVKDGFAENIQSLLALGALDSMSVGMRIKDYEPIDPKQPYGGWMIKQADVYEGSIVTIPANELALIESSKEITDKERAELMSLRKEKRFSRANELLKQAQGLLSK